MLNQIKIKDIKSEGQLTYKYIVPSVMTYDFLNFIMNTHDKQKVRYDHLEKYYRGHHKIKDEPTCVGVRDNRIVNNFPKSIVDIASGYFLGKPISYQSDNDITEIKNILNKNDEHEVNSEHARQCSIYGSSAEILSQVNGEISIASVKPSEMVFIYDPNSIKDKLIGAFRVRKIYDINNTVNSVYIDHYDNNFVTTYTFLEKNKAFKSSKKNKHFFKSIPVIEVRNNTDRMGDFEGVISIVDAYNKAQSNTANDLDDHTDSYLVLINMLQTGEKDLAAAKLSKTMLLDENGGAEWLTKTVNDNWIENSKNRYKDDIHHFSKIPDLSDESFGGNMSGVAIKFKLWNLEQLVSIKERKFKILLRKRLDKINEIKSIFTGEDKSYNIEIFFTRNVPLNVLETAQTIATLKGMVSKKTLISQLPFIVDPKKEIDILNTELSKEVATMSTNYDLGGGMDGQGTNNPPDNNPE